MIAVAGHVVEVRPIELARWRRVEQQTVHVGSGAGGGGGEPVQPVECPQVPVAVDADEPRVNERSVRPQAGLDGLFADTPRRAGSAGFWTLSGVNLLDDRNTSSIIDSMMGCVW